MPILCPHQDAAQTKQACSHLVGKPDLSHLRYFLGTGLEYAVVCHACAKTVDEINKHIGTVCPACFETIEEEGYWDGVVGQPGVLFEPSRLNFVHQWVRLPELPSTELLVMQPFPGSEMVWVGLTKAGTLLRIDLEQETIASFATLPISKLDLTQHVSLHRV